MWNSNLFEVKDQELRHSFVQEIKQELLNGYNCSWGEVSMEIRETAKKTLGEISGKSKRSKETVNGMMRCKQ